MGSPASVLEPPTLTGVLGVLGGMGPLATAYFYQRVVEATPGGIDQDHLPVVVWGDPTVPDRSTALIDAEALDPTPWLLRGARALESVGAELIAVPCNSAHPFLADVRRAVGVPVVDIVRTTVARAADSVEQGGRIAVLCTEGAHRAEVYQRCLLAAGLVPVPLAPTTRWDVQSAISEIKAGRLPEAGVLIDGVLVDLQRTAPDLVIAGCTDLTMLRDRLAQGHSVVDSATALAMAAVAALRPEPVGQSPTPKCKSFTSPERTST